MNILGTEIDPLGNSAVRIAPCSRCGAQPGEECRTPKGRKKWPSDSHTERFIALHKLDPQAKDRATVRIVPATSLIDLLKGGA